MGSTSRSGKKKGKKGKKKGAKGSNAKAKTEGGFTTLNEEEED
jgi:hypothetical protein